MIIMYYGQGQFHQQQFIPCYYHPQYSAMGHCARCAMPGCMSCLQMIECSLFCGNCLQIIHHQVLITAARSRIKWSWIVTGSVASLYALSILCSIPNSSIGSIFSNIFSLLFISYSAWSLYWGWGPIVDGIRNFLGELGCAGCATTIPVWIALGVFIVMIAMVFGMCGGGVYRYYKARQLV